jgi:phosphopantothenoylcysteine decarboxylase / phosphopantothenate---cysteine ligase
MKDKNILVGICGGIPVYKICTLVNLFIKEGANVKVIMTKSAEKFVSSLTFQTLTNNVVYRDMFDVWDEADVKHISLAKWADLFVLAPATANTIGKIANGIADNFLTTVVMAMPKKTKIVFVPAMNSEMWNNKIVQKNINILKDINKKYIFTDPRSGILACRDKGIGKIPKNEDILELVKNILK